MATSTAILLTCLLSILLPVQGQNEKAVSRKMRNTVSELIEEANKYLGQDPDDPEIVDGDIAVPTGFQNADPCTAKDCKWPRSKNGLVYIPYVISNQYSPKEIAVIKRGLQSFAKSTCIRFRKHNNEQDYLSIESLKGCWSKMGRQGGKQQLSLSRTGCVYYKVVQHEILHALGFQHEQSRSDRNLHVKILWENIKKGKEHNFKKVNTNNLGTPYDYNSVMHYSKYAFSVDKKKKPTIVAVPDPNVEFGKATEMSKQDIRRVNLLYGCK